MLQAGVPIPGEEAYKWFTCLASSIRVDQMNE